MEGYSGECGFDSRTTEGSLEVLGEAFGSFSLVLSDQIWIFY